VRALLFLDNPHLREQVHLHRKRTPA